ncbi:MAG: hypothetical protein AB1722_04725 [Pseudomonadota bacterium]
MEISVAIPFDTSRVPRQALVARPRFDFHTFCSLRRMVAKQRSQWALGSADFMPQLTLHLSEVAEHVDESDFGHLHLEIGVFKLASRAAIGRGDLETWRRHLIWASGLMGRADKGLYDALRVSWLEALFLGETDERYTLARGMLPERLEQALREAERRHSRILARRL